MPHTAARHGTSPPKERGSCWRVPPYAAGPWHSRPDGSAWKTEQGRAYAAHVTPQSRSSAANHTDISEKVLSVGIRSSKLASHPHSWICATKLFGLCNSLSVTASAPSADRLRLIHCDMGQPTTVWRYSQREMFSWPAIHRVEI